MEFLRKIGQWIGSAAGAAGSFLKNNKKLVATGLYLAARAFPEYTAMGEATKFMKENLEFIQVGLDVGFTLLGSKAAYDIAKEKLPSGLRKQPDENQKEQK